MRFPAIDIYVLYITYNVMSYIHVIINNKWTGAKWSNVIYTYLKLSLNYRPYVVRHDSYTCVYVYMRVL